MFKNWVIDASMGWPPCFVPVEGDLNGDFTLVTGMNFVGSVPDGGKVVAVIHEDGQAAVEAFCAEHKAELDALLGKEP